MKGPALQASIGGHTHLWHQFLSTHIACCSVKLYSAGTAGMLAVPVAIKVEHAKQQAVKVRGKLSDLVVLGC